MKAKIIFNIILISVGISFTMMSGCVDPPKQKTPEEALQENLALVDQVQLQKDIKIIDDSLAKWGITPQIDPNGVRYVVHTQGGGPAPSLSSAILVNLRGLLFPNNSVFTQGNNQPFYLRELMAGWQTALPLVNKGSKVTLYIPSGLAYGPGGRIDPVDQTFLIPPHTNLIFEIDLLDVQ
jgi:FKBP-type peptidyl-prolyl cis-trans isomerase FkpA